MRSHVLSAARAAVSFAIASLFGAALLAPQDAFAASPADTADTADTAHSTEASAGAAASAPAPALEEIVITAERRESKAQSVPSTITAYDAAGIENRNVQTMEDLALITPGVSFVAAPSASNLLRIRGSSPGLISSGTDQPVVLMVDDVLVVGTTALRQELFDLDRIEVLRGPQGTLFGRNATGGAILLYTKKPSFDNDARLRLTVGDYGRAEAAGWATGAIVDNVLAGIISLNSRKYDGNYEDLIRNRRDQQLSDIDLRTSLLLKPMPGLSFQLTGYYTHDDDGGPEGFLTFGNIFGHPVTHSLLPPVVDMEANGRYLATAYQGSTRYHSQAVNGHLDWVLPVGTLTSITAWSDHKFDENRDGLPSPIPVFPSPSLFEDRLLTEEIRLASPGGQLIDWVSGIYFLDQHSRFAGSTMVQAIPGSAFFPATVPGTITSSQSTDTLSYALFGEGTYHVTDRWSLVLGARFTRDYKDGATAKDPGSQVINNPALAAFGLYQPAFFVKYSRNWSGFSPRATLSFAATQHSLLFATYSRGFRSGGFSLEGETASQAAVPLMPEYANNYEVGLKSRWFDRRLQVNTSLYDMKYQNLQGVLYHPDQAASTSGNIGDVGIKGLDLELLGRVLPGVTLGANYSYQRQKILKYTSPLTPASPNLTTNQSTSPEGKTGLAPPNTLTIFGDVIVPTPWNGQLSVHLDETLSSKVYFQPNDSDPAYIHGATGNKGTLNSALRYLLPNGHWEVELFGRNLTNERHIVNGGSEISPFLLTAKESYVGAGGTAVPQAGNGAFATFYNDPRSYGLRLTWDMK